MAKKSKGKSNIADVIAFLNKIEGVISSEIRSETNAVAKEVAEEIYRVSQEYVPEDTGALAESGKVVKNNNGNYTVEYGTGLERGYAFYVHENIPHDRPQDGGAAGFGAVGKAKEYTKPGSGPKYLERAADLVANETEMIKYLRDALGRFKKKITIK